ncbi:WD repeat-containing protein KIAA1875 [Biomphalaria glabrata]|nr:WD repeat-containing protein KIAA1875 [Biomphalaria glabrata]
MEKSEPDIFVKHKQQEVHERAKQCWDTLRQSVLSVKKVLEEADVKDVTLTHGIYRDRKLNHHQMIHQVMYIPEHKEYLSCDGHNFHLFQEDGIKKDVVKCEIKLNRFVYCNQTDQYVVWNHGEEDLFLMTKEFMIISQSVAIGSVTIGLYNEKTGELITIGPHFITSWIFRYRAKYLTPRKTIRTTFGEENMFAAVVLEDTASKSQKMYCAVGTGLVVYNLFSGLEVCKRTELHTQPITALSFFNPLKYVITGAKDGCIKVWDINWKVLMVFVGHSKEINFLKLYPHETCFISASLDCTMRVWSMETCDEIDKTIISEPISGIGTEMNSDIFYTFTGKRVDLWRIHHLYQMHTNIGYRVNRIKVTDHVAYPKRALLLCRDSSARIVCPCNGKVITTLLLQPSDGLVDAVYAIAEKTVFALLASGEIVKARTNCNPCQVVSRWKCNNITEQCSNLLVYEYIVDPTGDSDVWSKAKDLTKNGRGQKNIHSNKNRTLLLGGRKDGYICVIDWMTGEVTFKIEAHSGKSVLSIISNTKLNQIISAGMDNIIKVWRLFPFAEEALTPLMSFYCAHTPVHMTAIKTTLGVAFQDPSTATFSVVLYSLSDNSRNDHRPDDDHMDVITGFTSCARMKIYASCSMDGTIRIWSHTNSLIRILKVNSLPHSLSFCSSKGDLLVGINNHLFYIHHKQYLPKYYLRKQVCMKFLPIQNEDSIEYDENRLKALDKNDVKRLKNAHAAFTFPQYFDILSPEEEEAMLKEKQVREKAYGLLEIRDNELCQIRDGTLIAHNKPKATKKTRNKAFKEYMKIYYNKEKPKLPEEESIKEAVIRTLNQELKDYEGIEAEEEKYRAETPPVGFFPELAQKYQELPSLSTDHACLPSVINGYLPNSVLLKILFPPPKAQEEEKDKKPYQPPKLTRKQLAEIQSLNPRKPLQVDEDEISPDPPTRNVTFASDELLTQVLEIDNSDEEKNEEDKDGEMEEESAETKTNTPVVSSTQGSRTVTDLSGELQDYTF